MENKEDIMAGETIREYFTMQDGTKVPKLGFGCYNPGKLDFVAVLRNAVEAGYRYFDTASFLLQLAFKP